MPNAAIYIRRSDDDQSAFSPEAQERQCRLYAELHDLHVVQVYTDDDWSGTRGDRPAFQRLVTEAKARAFQAVIVHKIDRLARDAEVTLRTIRELDSVGVRLISVSEQIDFGTPIGRVMLTNLAAFAEYYSRNLSTEIKKGLYEKARQGYWVGSVPLGYRRVGRDLEPTDDLAVVQRIFALYATGAHSDATIRDILNADGHTILDVHTGERRPFQKESVGGILQNPAYRGLVVCGGETSPGRHPAAIDESLWQQAQAVRRLRAGRRGGSAPVRGAGGLLYWHVSSGGRYYRCSQRRKYGVETCSARMIPAGDAEDQVLAFVRSVQIPPAIRDAVIAVVQARIQADQPQPLADVTERLRRLDVVYLAGGLTDADYHRQRRALTEQARPQTSLVLDLERALQTLDTFGTALDAANDDERRGIVRQLIAAVWIGRGGIAAWQPTPLYAALAAAATTAQVDGVTPTGVVLPPATPGNSWLTIPRWTAFRHAA